MAAYHIQSTDAGYSALANTAGSLITLLDNLLVAVMGWTKTYSGTNVAAYKQPAGTNGMYLYVDDTAGTNARLIGYTSMSGGTGTGGFPLTTQLSGGLYINKTASMAWRFIGNGKFFYIVTGSIFAFGDILSFRATDPLGTFIMGQEVSTDTTVRGFTISPSVVSAGHYMAGSHTQIGGSIACSKYPVSGSTLYGTVPFPNPVDGGIYMSPVQLLEIYATSMVIRGQIPGMWAPQHPRTLITGDIFTGTGNLAGKTFVTVNSTGQDYLFIEISDTWSAF